MTKTLQKGDKVEWSTSQGETKGKVVKKQTSPTHIKSNNVDASKGDPQNIVKSDKSGKKPRTSPGLNKA